MTAHDDSQRAGSEGAVTDSEQLRQDNQRLRGQRDLLIRVLAYYESRRVLGSMGLEDVEKWHDSDTLTHIRGKRVTVGNIRRALELVREELN